MARKRYFDDMWLFGGGAGVALLRFNEAAKVVAKRYGDDWKDLGPGPTQDELSALRDRHLEYQALKVQDEKFWSLWRNGPMRIAGTVLIGLVELLYRLALLVAAILIIIEAVPRYFGP